MRLKPFAQSTSLRTNLRTNLFWRVLAGCLLALLTSVAFAAAPAGSWWDTNFPYRYKLTIPTGSSALISGYAVSITFDHAAAVTAGTSLASGDDVRVVLWNGSAWVELDRIANAPETWNTSSTRVWFKTVSAFASGVSDDNYYLYYGKTSATGTPPANGENVFTLHDEFNGTTLDTTRWTATGSTVSVSGGSLTLSPGDTLQSKSTFGTSTIWEARVSIPLNLPGGGSKFFYFWMASDNSSYTGNHVGFYVDTTNYYAWARSTATSSTTISSGSPTAYQIYSFTRETVSSTPSSAFSINGSSVATITSTNVPTGSLPVLVENVANGTRAQVYDWMRVRPYRNPEPVLTKPATPETLTVALHHFVVAHDGYGINCAPETITVSPRDASNAVISTYNQQITLTTNTGKGTWTKLTGSGTFTDAIANDGLATYQWVSGETSASFALFYPEGTQTFDVDVYQTSNTALRDDDTEGLLSFSPIGFLVTSSAITSNAIAGTAYTTSITAYGQTSSDPLCSVITGYAGVKMLKFWTSYTNPSSGTVRFTVDGTTSAATEGAAVAQSVTFTNGQATVSAKYKDVGSVALNVKDDTTGNPSLPTGIRGSGAMIVKPSNFGLVVTGTGGVTNPAATSASGAAFIAAGRSFSVTATAYDAEGSITPNYGKESPAESVALTQALVAPAGGNNPTLTSAAFGSFTGGSATANGFSWSEVGIISLTPHVADSNYLGAGDVTGTATNVGRFIPADFAVSVATTPVLQNACVAGGFSYVGQTLAYSTGPVLTVTARNASGGTTQNYTGAFSKLTSVSGQTTYTSNASGTSLVGTATDPTLQPLSAGQGTLTYPSSPSTLGVAFTHTTPIAPFTPQITLNLALRDSDNVTVSSSPYTLAMTAGPQRYGRVAFRNAVGSEIADLNVPLRTEFYMNDAQGFTTNTSDVCASPMTISLGTYSGNLNAGETCVQDTGNPGTSSAGCATAATDTTRRFSTTPSFGVFPLWLRAPGSGNQGMVTVTATVPAWLQYDWNPAVSGQENPSGIATFGIYQGNAKRLYTRERY